MIYIIIFPGCEHTRAVAAADIYMPASCVTGTMYEVFPKAKIR